AKFDKSQLETFTQLTIVGQAFILSSSSYSSRFGAGTCGGFFWRLVLRFCCRVAPPHTKGRRPRCPTTTGRAWLATWLAQERAHLSPRRPPQEAAQSSSPPWWAERAAASLPR